MVKPIKFGKFGKQGNRINEKELLIEYLKARTVYINDCWIYDGGSLIADGHTRVDVDGRVIGVHRLSAYLYLGLDLDDDKQQANHKNECGSKRCWNPEHLYVGTHKQNMKDFVDAKTHCKRGHPYGNPNRFGKRRCKRCNEITEKIRKDKLKNNAKD